MSFNKINHLVSLVGSIVFAFVFNVHANNDVNIANKSTVPSKVEVVTKKEAIEKTVENKININTADLTQLQQLNGIGVSKAQAIIAFRNQNGKFNNVDDILAVPGVGKLF